MSKNNYEHVRAEVARKYNEKLDTLNSEVKSLRKENSELQIKLDEATAVLREKDEWIERLLNYMELDPETVKESIERQNRLSDTMEEMSTLMNRFKNGPYSGLFGGLF